MNISNYWQADTKEKRMIEREVREDKAELAAKNLLHDLGKFYNFKLREPAYTRFLTGLSLFLETLAEEYMTQDELLSFINAFGEGLDSPF